LTAFGYDNIRYQIGYGPVAISISSQGGQSEEVGMGVPGGFFDDVVQAGTGALAAALFTLVVTFISYKHPF
jgi:hypothetical protein